jgi:quaternary ammonium compound-resistance protein SugE
MSSLAAWALLFAAGLLEVAMAFALKASAGWSRLGPSVLAVLAALASIALLAGALRALPLGLAYAVWTGLGALGVSLVGYLFYSEHLSALRLLCMGLILIGIAGLKALAAETTS